MKQYEQVIQVMRENGGFATLGFLNHTLDVSKWKTKTPFASIRRIVQDERFFFKIKPGLWALKEYHSKILNEFDLQKSPEKEENFSHSYFQGLLLEIGNLKGYNTYVSPQDKNKMFLNKKLGSISTIDRIFNFSYKEIVQRARTVDVIWFNERNLPNSLFEVEYSANMFNSLIKFNDLRDFHSNFYILSAIERKREFEQKISNSAFKEIKSRVKFVDYEFISAYHSKSFELEKIGKL